MYLSLFACGQMLFHLWLFTMQSHKRLHSVALFSSQTGHPYFCTESNENIDGLRYCGFVWRKPTRAWYFCSLRKDCKNQRLAFKAIYASPCSKLSKTLFLQNIDRYSRVLLFYIQIKILFGFEGWEWCSIYVLRIPPYLMYLFWQSEGLNTNRNLLMSTFLYILHLQCLLILPLQFLHL